MALDFFAGCLGGCAGVLVGHPLDTIKVMLQTQDFKNPQYKGTIDCFRKIVAKDSVQGLYKGMSSPMAGVALVNAIVFGVQGNVQRGCQNPDALSSHFLAGSSAGFVQSFVCSPIELAKTRLQVQKTSTYKGPLDCLLQIARKEKSRGVFKGLGITMLRDTPAFGIYFLSYELMMQSFRSDRQVSTGMLLFAGGMSGTMSWLLTYPIDVIKSRLQTDGLDGLERRYTGALDCLKKSVRIEGYSVLTRGLTSTLIRSFPTNAATFATVEWVFRIAKVLDEKAAETVLKNEVLTIDSSADILVDTVFQWEGISASCSFPKSDNRSEKKLQKHSLYDEDVDVCWLCEEEQL